jgi:ribosomal 50S subunit-associated protein YjgA (DUF615 family)
MNMKLRNLIENVVKDEPTWSNEEKKRALEMIGKYNEYGHALRRETNLLEIAEKLQEISNYAESFTMNESEDWFDKVTIDRNMKDLKKLSESFAKLARETYTHEQRMEALYEDAGMILNRYFEIKDSIAESKMKK